MATEALIGTPGGSGGRWEEWRELDAKLPVGKTPQRASGRVRIGWQGAVDADV